MALSNFSYYRLYHLIRLLEGIRSSPMSGHNSDFEVQCSWVYGALPSIEVELDTVHS